MMIGTINNIDTAILNFIHNSLQCAILDKIMPAATFLGNNGLIWIVISAALIISKKYRKAGILAACALILSTLVGEVVLKNIVKRPRPFMEIEGIKLLIPKLYSYSFPSGHTMAAFATSAVLAKTMRRWSVPLFTLAGLIAFSRMYLFVHYPSDVLAGIILGFGCAWVVLRLPVNRLFDNRRKFFPQKD